MIQVWRCETKDQVPSLYSTEPSAERYRVGRWCVKNGERRTKQGTWASTTGAETRPHVPGRDSQCPKVRSNHMLPSFSRPYHETHPLLLQGSVAERVVVICSKHYFRYVVLITYIEVAAHNITSVSCGAFLCAHVQASARYFRAGVHMLLPVWHTQPSRNPSDIYPPLASSSCTAHELRSHWDKSMDMVRIPSLLSGRESLCWRHLQ